MKRCRGGANFPCHYASNVSNGSFCTLPEDSTCILQEECGFGVGNCVEAYPPLVGVTPTEELEPQIIMGKHNEASTVAAGVGVKVGPDDKNKIKICCNEITLTNETGVPLSEKALKTLEKTVSNVLSKNEAE